MGLLNTLKNIKQEGFDPLKDSIGGGGGLLPEGKYPVRIVEAERGVRGDRVQLVVKLEVVSGEYKERKEVLFLSFDDSLPEFVIEQNGKILIKLIEFAKIKYGPNDFDDEEAAAETLKKGIGNQFLMDLVIRPNKKNPDYPYRNYDFSALQENSPFDTGSNDGDELDLPF